MSRIGNILNEMSNPKRYYVYNFGAIYSLVKDDIVKLLNDFKKDGQFSLYDYKSNRRIKGDFHGSPDWAIDLTYLADLKNSEDRIKEIDNIILHKI